MRYNKTNIITAALCLAALSGCTTMQIVQRYGEILHVSGKISKFDLASDSMQSFDVTGTFPAVPVEGLKGSLEIEHHGHCDTTVVHSNPSNEETSGFAYYKCERLGEGTLLFKIAGYDAQSQKGDLYGHIGNYSIKTTLEAQAK